MKGNKSTSEPIVLSLELKDIYGAFLKENVNIVLHNQNITHVVRVTVKASTKINIKGLKGAPQGLYKIDVDPPSYRYVSQFINMQASGTTELKMTFPINPYKVKNVFFPKFDLIEPGLQQILMSSGNVSGFENKSGKELYDALDDIRRAGLLNVIAKIRATLLTNKRTVLSYIQELHEIRGDRFFAFVPGELREETKNSVAEGLFNPAPDILHHPPQGFTRAGSFKTPGRYGNLQLSFFRNDAGDYMVDIDIDDANGIEHIFQLADNLTSPSGQTHPYNIHQILVGYQHNDPGYSFQV